MFVKICGVTSAEDALLAAGLGADAVGLNFAAISPRRISIGRATEMAERLPPEVMTVGVFRDELPERVVEISEKVGLQAVQLHGRESFDETRWVAERVPMLIRALSIKDPSLAAADEYGADRLLIDSPMPGSGESFDWSLLDRLTGGRPYILAGGLNPGNVATAISQLAPWGVDVASGVEASPRSKDPVKVRKFVQTARRAADESARRAADESARPAAVDRPVGGARSVRDSADGLHVDTDAVVHTADTGDHRPYDWGEDS